MVRIVFQRKIGGNVWKMSYGTGNHMQDPINSEARVTGKIQVTCPLPELRRFLRWNRGNSFVRERDGFKYQRSFASTDTWVACALYLLLQQSYNLAIILLFYFLGNWGSHIRKRLINYSQEEWEEGIEGNCEIMWTKLCCWLNDVGREKHVFQKIQVKNANTFPTFFPVYLLILFWPPNYLPGIINRNLWKGQWHRNLILKILRIILCDMYK